MIQGLFGMNIVVRNLDEAISKFETILGVKAQMGNPEDFAFPGIKGAGLVFNGLLISLLTSDRDDNPVGKFLSKKGEGIILISIKTDNIKQDQTSLTEKGIQFMMPDTFKGPYGQVNFIPAKAMHGVQVELIEPAGKFKG